MFGALNSRVEQEFKVIDKLNGFDFEEYCAYLLELNEYQKADVTKRVGDYGTDVVAERDGVKFAIQCKRQDADVGISSVQEILSGKTYYGCHVGIVLTNSNFLQHTIDYAAQLGVVLWDRERLQNFIIQALLKIHGQIYERILSPETIQLAIREADCLEAERLENERLRELKPSQLSRAKQIIVDTLQERGPMERELCMQITQAAGASSGVWERARKALVDEGVIVSDTVHHGQSKTTTYRLASHLEAKQLPCADDEHSS